MTGKTYTSFRTRTCKERPFQYFENRFEKTVEELYERINRRVDMMMDEGLLEEVKAVYAHRNLDSLNTVGS